jgi:hypothetical protein
MFQQQEGKQIAMSKSDELINASQELGIASYILTSKEGADFIHFVLDLYKPNKLSGHLAIHHDSVSIPLEPYEFTYSTFMAEEPAYVFFEQKGTDINKVVVVEEGNRLGEILENSYGMEYFVSNKTANYLLAVNWYVIEGSGSAIDWLTTLNTSTSLE